MAIYHFLHGPGINNKRTAIDMGNKSLSYEALNVRVSAIIGRLHEKGVRPGDRVAVVANVGPELYALYFTASYLGLSLVLPYQLHNAVAEEWNKVLEESASQWLLYDQMKVDVVKKIAFPDERAICLQTILPVEGNEMPDRAVVSPEKHILLQQYTSGTTGRPKGVCNSEKAVEVESISIADMLKMDGDTRFLLFGAGIPVSMAVFSRKGTLVFRDSMNPLDIFKEVEERAITHIMLPPFILSQALNDPLIGKRDLRLLKTLAYGGATMPEKTLARARALLPCELIQGYGLTETTGPVVWRSHKDLMNDKGVGGVGRPAPHAAVSIWSKNDERLAHGTVGRVMIKSDTMMSGYWHVENKKPKAPETLKNNWLDSGDLGYLDEEGYLYLKGRSKDCIVTGTGFTVYPKDIEAVIQVLDDVSECCVVSWDAGGETGEVPVAIIRTRAKQPIETDKITTLLENKISPAKHPRYILFTNDPLPRNRYGEVEKHLLINRIDELKNSGTVIAL